MPDTDRDPLSSVQESVGRYYTKKIRKYGATALGVDWSCAPSQELRFVQLMKIVDFGRPSSLNDVGCGYGALLGYLSRRHANSIIDYCGSDLSAEMIRSARRKWRNKKRATFVVAPAALRTADYSVASGIFNVKLDHPLEAWELFISNTMLNMSNASRKGFAVNFMAPLVSQDASANPLYRAPARRWTEYSRAILGCEVQVVEDYGLREYTLLLRHQDGISDVTRERASLSAGS